MKHIGTLQKSILIWKHKHMITSSRKYTCIAPNHDKILRGARMPRWEKTTWLWWGRNLATGNWFWLWGRALLRPNAKDSSASCWYWQAILNPQAATHGTSSTKRVLEHATHLQKILIETCISPIPVCIGCRKNALVLYKLEPVFYQVLLVQYK